MPVLIWLFFVPLNIGRLAAESLHKESNLALSREMITFVAAGPAQIAYLREHSFRGFWGTRAEWLGQQFAHRESKGPKWSRCAYSYP
jgi:hypothetical protein